MSRDPDATPDGRSTAKPDGGTTAEPDGRSDAKPDASSDVQSDVGAQDGHRPPIQVLPDDIVDQIAAGEVVERPASVVKELVENALDAGATHITVEVEHGGKRLIRVLDNGVGMSPDQARLALTRHATSKLRHIDDLFSLSTLGFRGEALPSIAAVSHMILVTRTSDQLAGTRFEIRAGVVESETEVGAPVGTVIEIRSLLANIPARLKFLKGNATEASHVTDVVTKLALAHPKVHIRLRHGSRTAIDAPASESGLERIRAVLGTRLGKRVHRVSGDEGGVLVTAYLADPALAQTTSRPLQLFVGRRAVKDRGLLHAVRMGYGELVPKGRYPVAVVFVSVPEGSLDVNVHPQKLEVRFSEPQIVYAAVRHTVRRGVGAAPWLADGPPEGVSPVRMRALAARVPPEGREASALAAGYARDTARMLLPFGPAGAGESATWTPPAGSERWGRDLAAAPLPVAEPGAAYDPGGPRGGGDAAGDDASAGDPAAAGDLSELRPPAPTDDDAVFDARGDAGAPGPGAGGDAYGSRTAGSAEPGAADAGRAGDGSAARTPAAGSADAATFFSRLRYIGQLDRTYLLCEADGELILIDQHAAHERVAFQRLRERYQQRELPVQRVLFPEQIELGADQAAVAEDSRDTLSALGFEVEPFGGDTWVIKTVPAGLRAGDAASEVLRALLGELAERGGSRAVEERLDLALATIACHSVVRAGDALSPREVVALLSSMDGVDFKAHCPHGRPVLLRISVGEIARRFGRT